MKACRSLLRALGAGILGVVLLLNAALYPITGQARPLHGLAAPVVTSGFTGTISINGNHFVNGAAGAGSVIQLRGVNVSGLENSSAQGSTNVWADGGYATTPIPLFSQLGGSAWKANVVRIPVNVASWLGSLSPINGVAYNGDGSVNSQSGNPDPSGTYKAALVAVVQGALTAGMYPIIDAHWSAPDFTLGGTAGRYLMPLGQSPMADAASMTAFWTDIANTFKSYPGVMFEGFNEPYMDSFGGPFTNCSGTTETDWYILLNGGCGGSFVNYTGLGSYTITATWTILGHQQILNAIRATGATNVYLASTLSYDGDLSGYASASVLNSAQFPTDSLNQVAITWHPYPVTQSPSGTPTITAGGTGWTSGDVGKTITLATPVGCYYATELTITSVSGGAVTGATYLSYSFPGSFQASNGLWLTTEHPSGSVAQASTTGAGTGVSISFGAWTNYSSQYNLPSNWGIPQKIATTYPLIITETGDHNSGGNTSTAPWLAQLLPWADTYGMSVLGWGYYISGSTDYILISNQAGAVTPGYGVYFRNWMATHP